MAGPWPVRPWPPAASCVCVFPNDSFAECAMTPTAPAVASPVAPQWPTSIPRLLFQAAQRHGAHAAIEEDGVATAYADLPALALEVSRGLLAHGIEVGDRVAVWAPNS